MPTHPVLKKVILGLSFLYSYSIAYSQDSVDQIIRIQQQVVLPGKTDQKDTAYKIIFLSITNNTDSLWIPQYGYIPANGSITLISGLPFMSVYAKNKTTLKKRFRISDVTLLEGGLKFDAPRATDFPALGREEKIVDGRTFDDKVRNALNRYARIGLLHNEEHGEVTIITPFIALALPTSSPYDGYAAFLIKYNLTRPLYQISLLAEQSFHSDPEMRIAQSDDIKNAAADLLQKIINDFAK